MRWLSKNLVEGTKIMNMIFKHVLPKGMNDYSEQDGYEAEWEKTSSVKDTPIVCLTHPRAILNIHYFDVLGAMEDGEGPQVLLQIRDAPGKHEPKRVSFYEVSSSFYGNWSDSSNTTPWLRENMPDIVTAGAAFSGTTGGCLNDRKAIKHLHFMRDTFLALRGK